MRATILINIDEEYIKRKNLTYKEILSKTLDSLSELYDSLDLSFDCGYNPELITNGSIN